jgi:hypothetical protein
MILFTKCNNGHIYNSELEECPYCNGRKIDDDLDDLGEEEKIDFPETAMCYDIGYFDNDDDNEW